MPNAARVPRGPSAAATPPTGALQVLDGIAPAADEMVIPKTTSSVFSSTNLDFILRSMGKKVGPRGDVGWGCGVGSWGGRGADQL